MIKLNSALTSMCQPVIESFGCEFVGGELLSMGRGKLLRLYIDKQGGIDLDNCAEISRQLSGLLEVEDPIRGKYRLEVSSPGIERPLYEIAHFEKFIGHRAKVALYDGINDRRNFVGEITAVTPEGKITLHPEDMTEASIDFPYDNIKRAHLAPKFE